tara:strand:- start:22850 stop:23044 length:195 start_codon:yes stop_codon:yes gene_type:complete
MTKVLLDYDKNTGNISKNGTHIASWAGLGEYEEPEVSNIDAMVKLKNSGFTAKEVIELGKAGLL